MATSTVTPQVSVEEYNRLKALVEKLQAEKSAKANQKLTLKVSEKGGLSVYGLGRFPVTLYLGQWLRLIAAVDEIKAFIEKNRAKLAVKD